MDEVVVLSEAECRDLMETDTVGRVAFVTPAGPRIVPVNYALHGETIEMRTTSYSELAVYGPGTRSPSRSTSSTASGDAAGAWSRTVSASGSSSRTTAAGTTKGPDPSRGPAGSVRCGCGCPGASSPAAGWAASTGRTRWSVVAGAATESRRGPGGR